KNRKVCISGPGRLPLAQDLLKEAGCEVILGKSVDDFPGFRYKKEELVGLIGDADALLISTREAIGREILEPCKNLQGVIKASIGVEKIDLKAATDLGILVCNSPAPENFIGLAEAAIGLMVALFKRLKLNEAHVRQGGWKEGKNRGQLMLGKTIGIIGLGRVGRHVAERLGPWELRLIGYDPYVKQETVDYLGVKLVSLDEVLSTSDLITIHVMLTAETRHMITLNQLKMMKPTAYLVNTSRGAAVKEKDLVQALNEGIIAGAALDVFEEEPLPTGSPLRGVDPARLILTPHIIGNNPGSVGSGHRMAVESILSILEGKVPATVLNPEAVDRWKAKFWS
ncbi:MAG: NAD(P)-dependent oxidoreductase, partial [Candidatus Binatia bacterium]